MKIPALADERRDAARRCRASRPGPGSLAALRPGAAGHAEGGEPAPARASAARRRTRRRSGWRRASRPRHSRCRAVELARDRDLVGHAEIDALGLRAVAQRGVVEIDALGHRALSRPAPGRAAGPVLEENAVHRKLGADAVGLGEIARLAGVVAALRSGPRFRRPRRRRALKPGLRVLLQQAQHRAARAKRALQSRAARDRRPCSARRAARAARRARAAC